MSDEWCRKSASKARVYQIRNPRSFYLLGYPEHLDCILKYRRTTHHLGADTSNN